MRIPNLDLARAAAIIGVVQYHTVVWLPHMPAWIKITTNTGEYGLDLFFALSGYLIGGIYFREYFDNGDVDIGLFLTKRATRIIPPYFVALFFVYLGSLVFEGERFRLEYLGLVQNYLSELPYFNASWSLCIEEHFYVLFPFIYLFLDKCVFKLKNEFRLFPVLFILFLPLAGRFLIANKAQLSNQFGYYLTATHLHYDAIALGVLAAYIEKRKLLLDMPKSRLISAFVPFLLLLGSLIVNTFSKGALFVLGPTLIGLMCAMTIYIAGSGYQFSLSNHRSVRFIATISFSIYLVHGIAMQVVNKIFSYLGYSDYSLFLWFSLILASIVLGYIFYVLIERPLMDKRHALISYFCTPKTQINKY